MSTRRRNNSGTPARELRSRTTKQESKLKEEKEEDDDEEMEVDEEEDSEFEPSEEEDEPKSKSRAPLRKQPSRTRSTPAAASAATTSSSSSSSSSSRALSRSSSKQPAKKVKKKKSFSSDEEAEESEEEEESSSDSEDEAQCASLKRKRPSKRKSRDTDEEDDDDDEEDEDASSVDEEEECEIDEGGAKMKKGEKKAKHKKKVDPRAAEFQLNEDSESLLATFNRMRSLYEAPSSNLDQVFIEHSIDGQQNLARAKSSNAKPPAAAAAASSSSSSTMEVDATGPRLIDFTTRLPVSVSQLVFRFLSPSAVARFERVNKLWRTCIQPDGPGVYKHMMGTFFPLLKRIKDAEMRHQESDVDPKIFQRQASDFFDKPNPEGQTAWAARRTDGKAVPVFDPYTAKGESAPETEEKIEDVLKPKEGVWHWKKSLINRLANTCVECRKLSADVFKLTSTRVCIECAMHHPTGKYDVVNSGCARNKFMLNDKEINILPAVIEFDPIDGHKAIFYLLAMVKGLAHLKYGGEQGFQNRWNQMVAEATARLQAKRDAGKTKKKKIPARYRDNVGSTPQKTKGFFLCGRHNLATLFEKVKPERIYPGVALE